MLTGPLAFGASPLWGPGPWSAKRFIEEGKKMHEKGKHKGVLIAHLLEVLKAIIVGMERNP